MNKNCFGKLRFSVLFMLAFLSLSRVHGQGSYDTTNWRFSNPKPFGFTVQDLDFFDNNKAIAVGSDGGISFTTDGGKNWTYGPFTYTNPAGLKTKTAFSDVHFVSANVAYAVGPFGCMAKTTNGGQSWSFVNTPLFATNKNINAVWFINENTGYIGGQWNTLDSIPKLYVTNNGGATWDSLSAPVGGKTRVGYINNPNLAPLIWDITAKGKEIHRIEFTSPTTGYIIGGGQQHFPPFPSANASTCLPSGGVATTSANNAALVWKFSNGVLTDYSLSKERLGYAGIITNTITCTTQYTTSQIAPVVQTYKAMNIINDSLIVLMSFNNNTVVRVHTGVNDNTVNVATGQPEKGRYQVMSFPFPPTQGPNAHLPIPNPNTLLASNPYQIKRAANGKLYAAGNFARLWTSVDTGRTWVQERSLPPGQNFSNNGTWALDITSAGKFFSMGTHGVMADSIPGGSGWNSNYVTTPASAGYEEMEFVDCNTGIAAGSSSISVTRDGGKTWIDRARVDFANLFISITGFSFPAHNKAWFTTNVGNLYLSVDTGATLDPVYSNPNLQLTDVATVGNDSIWVSAYSAFSVPAASRTSSILKSVDNGATWQTIGGFPTGSTSPRFDKLAFPSKNVGYVAGTRNAVYKTTDGGTTWTDISPFPSLNNAPTGFPNAFVTYKEVFALDENTVFLVGNMFTNVAVKRVYKTTDGGATWVDITSNIPSFGFGNLNGILMHDANNGYVVSPGGILYSTNNGGTSWTLDIAPTACLFETMAFAPRKVPASVSMANRKLFVTGFNVSGAPMMEYGNLANIYVNTTETTVNATCTSLNGGRITINATGGIPPYSYSIDGGAFQSSNVFSGLTKGPKTITVKDSYCGTFTKTVDVGFTNNLTVNAGPDKSIVFGGSTTLSGSSSNTPQTIQWTPANSLTGATTLTPVAKPDQTTMYTLTVKDMGDCIASDSTVVTVINECIKVMEAFTPNGDGINDKWMVTNGSNCSTKLSVSVFNRYGGTVYKNDNYNNDWNGTYNGKPVADGTYYYVATIYMIGGRIDQVKGNVTILR